MKQIKYIASMLLALSLPMVTGCEDFLDSQSYTSKNTGNMPQTEQDILNLLAGAYSVQNMPGGDVKYHPYIVSETASDERFGGCGENSTDVQGFDKLLVHNPSSFDSMWKNRYRGINRANNIIENINRCTDFKTEQTKGAYRGEAYFLRALYYWDLGQLFETVPMPLSTEPVNSPRPSADTFYGQICQDFLTAIETMPQVAWSETESGHASRWAAQAFLARVFLFYTGFYEKESLVLPNGHTLTKQEVAAQLDDCIQKSGHGLIPDFRNLWSYSNIHTKKNWPYAQDNNLNWATDVNKEIMFAIKFSKAGTIPATQKYRNFFVVWQGLPTKKPLAETFPYAGGWAVGSVNPKLWEDWKAQEPDDIRRLGSIVDLDEEIPTYRENGFDSWEETMYRAKKFMPTAAKGDNGVLYKCFTSLQFPGVPNTGLATYIMDMPLMRYADVLLMHAELTQTADGINEVRSRAGLPAVGYSLEALKRERRWELSFEGVRWNDIRRWHDAESVLDTQIGVTVYNRGAEAVMPAVSGGYVARYQKTKGFFRIPQTQIDLSAGVISQNPGWGDGDNYTYTTWH